MATNCYCQVKNDSILIPFGQVCGVDLEFPHFPGGVGELMNFINTNILIPDSVYETGLSSRIFLKIAIDTTGTLTKVSVIKGINQSIDTEFLRVFSIMPKWIPGIKDGKKISGEFVMPIKFEFNKSDEKK